MPSEAANRAADRARAATAAAEVAMVPGNTHTFVFVERGGSASATEAISGIVGKIESELGSRFGDVAHLARCEASAVHQAELEAAKLETAETKKKLFELKARESERETEARRCAKELSLEIAYLQALLGGEQKRADAPRSAICNVRS